MIAARFFSVQSVLSSLTSACASVSKFGPPSRVSDKSHRSNPLTAEANRIVMESTPVFRRGVKSA